MRDKIIIFLGVFVAIGVPLFITQLRDIDREKQGCERLNVVRTELYNTINTAEQLTQTPETKQIFLQQKEILEASVSLYPKTSTENPVDIDCSEAYPYPFPFQ